MIKVYHIVIKKIKSYIFRLFFRLRLTFLIIYDIILSLNYTIKKECKKMNLINQPEQVSQYCLVSSLALREAKNDSKYVE